ncbi:MAG: molybdopterin-dependent oxidoreductase [Saprospiraceae bacterium]|nr:molybdopterin-dependent oxidoreductase [Saprospiraceae bacterium]
MSTTTVHKSACILCSINCGIDIEVDDATQKIVKITGDKDHPTSQGYICQKATRLNYYQDQERLTTPLRKREDGTFEAISWDTAIQEIADKLVQIRDTHGGTSIAYAGGGGQGNHMAQMYAAAFRKTCGTPYIYSSIAQEKTGNFWVHGKLFGRQNVAYGEPIDEAEFGVIIGANPMQAHGMARARKVIGEIGRDKNRTLVVIDPRATETAKKADYWLQVKPGRDAWLMSAMLGIIVQEGLEDGAFIEAHTNGFEAVMPYFMDIPVQEYTAIAGVPYELVLEVTRKMAAAKTVAIRSDLGIEMSLNSTLNSYLKRLLFLITGNFNKKGTNHLVTWFIPLIGHSRDLGEGGMTTKVTKAREIAKVYPPNVLSLEIDTDHPERLRALVVDSCNPVLNWADTQAQIKAYKKLDLMVVVDVAMTETAREAHYVLPASNQFEKYESAFFTENFYHLRKPIFSPLEGTLSEPEIYSRLIKAMGALEVDLSELQEAAQKDKENPGQGIFQGAFMQASMQHPELRQFSAVVLRETLGKTLPDGADSAAFLWFAAQLYASKYPEAIRNAGIEGKGAELGNIIFDKILNSPSGIKVSKHDYSKVWDLMKTPDKKVNLYIPELLEDWLLKLPEVLENQAALEREYPFNLIAGERRTYNANAVIRNLEWAKTDKEGFLKVHPTDAAQYQIEEGDAVQLTSPTGAIKILVTITDEVQPGVISMPHGHGLNYGKNRSYKEVGAMPNVLTTATYCDPLAKTPYHKNVRVKLEKVLEEAVELT